MADLRQMLWDAQAAHVEAHGPRCGVTVGQMSSDPCVLLRKAWARTFRAEARHEKNQRLYYRDRDQQLARAKRYRDEHKLEISERHRELRLRDVQLARANERKWQRVCHERRRAAESPF